MNVTPTQILRLLMQDAQILMQLQLLYTRSAGYNPDTEEAIRTLCDRVDWGIKFIKARNGFTYEDITNEPERLPSVLTVFETIVSVSRELLHPAS